MKTTFTLISLLLLSTACVVTPPTHLPPDSVEVHGSIEPRVHFGSRSRVSIWLHPQYSLPDAYVLAQDHCRSFGLWADPYRDWAFNSPNPRILNYNCIGRRPIVVYPHIRRPRHINRPPVVIRPPRRGTIAPTRPPKRPWYRPRPIYTEPRVETPEVRPPRRPGRDRRSEIGKPWEHNDRKEEVYQRPERRREFGKPWEYKRKKDQGERDRSYSRPSRRNTFTRTTKSKPSLERTNKSSSKRPKRSTLSL